MKGSKILLHYPKWGNRWEPYVLDALSEYDVTVHNNQVPTKDEVAELSKDKDILLSMWCNQVVGFWSRNFPEKKIVTYMRRFELWCNQFMVSVDWANVDSIIFVNDFIAEQFHELFGKDHEIKYYMIPNGIDLDEWKFSHVDYRMYDPYKIALVASMKHVKNIPLAAAILLELPPAYHIHHIGLHTENFTGELLSYIHGLGLSDRWHWDQSVGPDEMQDWLKDKAMLLNPSINEGNPNCVIEAMAMGIKPVIHAWPGAYDQFPPSLIFKSVGEACAIIKNGNHMPEYYRQWVSDRFSVENFQKLTEAIGDL